MNPQDASLPGSASLFGDYQLGGNSRGHTHEAVPESPFTGTSVFTDGPPSFSQTTPSITPVNEVAAVSLRAPRCPQCKGKRFDFKAYFHNAKFFHSPPHELLHLVERSYVLKNRLQSILVTYVVHDLREDFRMQDIRAEILNWARQVSSLAAEVRDGMMSAEGVSAGLAGVQTWSEGMGHRLGEHLERSNGRKMDVPNGWKKEVLSDFRKQWEKVWIACANAGSPKQGESSQDH